MLFVTKARCIAVRTIAAVTGGVQLSGTRIRVSNAAGIKTQQLGLFAESTLVPSLSVTTVAVQTCRQPIWHRQFMRIDSICDPSAAFVAVSRVRELARAEEKARPPPAAMTVCNHALTVFSETSAEGGHRERSDSPVATSAVDDVDLVLVSRVRFSRGQLLDLGLLLPRSVLSSGFPGASSTARAGASVSRVLESLFAVSSENLSGCKIESGVATADESLELRIVCFRNLSGCRTASAKALGDADDVDVPLVSRVKHSLWWPSDLSPTPLSSLT